MLNFLKHMITEFATFVTDLIMEATESDDSPVIHSDVQDSDYNPKAKRAVIRKMIELHKLQTEMNGLHLKDIPRKKSPVKRKRHDDSITSLKKMKYLTVNHGVRINDGCTIRCSGFTGKIVKQFSSGYWQSTTLEAFTTRTSRIVKNAKKIFTTLKNEETIVFSTNIILQVVKKAISLLDEDRTIPHVARYRREEIEALLPEKLRETQISYDEVKLVRQKVENIQITMERGHFDGNAAATVMNAKTLNEAEFLCAPLKSGRENISESAMQMDVKSVVLQLETLPLSQGKFADYIKPQKGKKTTALEPVKSSLKM